jgi:hypothetical protein
MGRIASNLGLSYKNEHSIGSTWYSTPKQFQIVSYLSLLSMIYLYENEFTTPERKGEIGVINWPEWHYGVMLLYGAHIAINHLWAENEINFVKLPKLFDQGTGSTESIDKIPHLHVFHGDNMFSKFAFKAGKYNNMTVAVEDRSKVKFYCLHMALEGNRLNATELKAMRDLIVV